MRRGGSKAVWNFSKNSSVLVGRGFPYFVLTFVATSKTCNLVTFPDSGIFPFHDHIKAYLGEYETASFQHGDLKFDPLLL